MLLKNLFILITVLHLNTVRPVQFPKQDIIESANIVVINKNRATYSSGSPDRLQAAFGKTRIVKEADEVLGGFAYTYKYMGFEVYFNGKNWEAMTLTGPQYQILLNGKAYAVGDHIDKLRSQFPTSYKNRTTGKDAMIGLYISHKKVLTDAYLTIRYNTRGIITNIEVANNNS